MSVALRRVAALALAAAVLVADQWLKFTLMWRVGILHGPVEITPFFRLTYVQNYGVSLGLLPAQSMEMRWLLVALTSAIALGVLVWIVRERRLFDLIALGLVLGGALGNIRDRVMRSYVVDYADLHFGDVRPFLIFNLADAAITIGVVLILARSLLSSDAPSKPIVPET